MAEGRQSRHHKGLRRALWPVLILSAAFFAFSAVRFFRELTGAMAVSTASDLITGRISRAVGEKMRDLDGEKQGFLRFEKDDEGNITAIVTDTPRLNMLSSELLSEVVEAANAGDINVHVPLGDLLGSSLLLGKGPAVPMKVTLLTSSRVNWKNRLTDAGINQTRHQLVVEVRVDADVLLPWEIRSAQITDEVLISETVIVGRVPQTLFQAVG